MSRILLALLLAAALPACGGDDGTDGSSGAPAGQEGGGFGKGDDGNETASAVATLRFLEDGDVAAEGTLMQGGRLRVEYDVDRMTTCRGTHNGYRFWEITGSVKFAPGGDVVERMLADGRPIDVEVPADATGVELWFHNYTGDRSCEDWDSLGGENYRFEVAPAPEPESPVQDDVEQDAPADQDDVATDTAAE
jgi:hypothetical protein